MPQAIGQRFSFDFYILVIDINKLNQDEIVTQTKKFPLKTQYLLEKYGIISKT